MKYEYINFRPYVGEKYFSEGFHGKRLLVLGESHYCTKELKEGGRCFPICRAENMLEDCHSQTEDVIDAFIYNYDGSRYQQTFLCFERALAGKILTQEEREDLWSRFVFYNYVQFCQPGPRLPIADEYWAPSEKAFKELLEVYLPDYIIIWGNRLYANLPDWNGEHSVLTADGMSTDVWTYEINGKRIPAIRVHHPSTPSGKAWDSWHELYKAFMKLSE